MVGAPRSPFRHLQVPGSPSEILGCRTRRTRKAAVAAKGPGTGAAHPAGRDSPVRALWARARAEAAAATRTATAAAGLRHLPAAAAAAAAARSSDGGGARRPGSLSRGARGGASSGGAGVGRGGVLSLVGKGGGALVKGGTF
jgi:hypothetical protein